MSRRGMMVGLVIMSAVATFVTEANAQFFDGWGWFGFSDFTGILDLRGVPNPDKKPTIVFVNANLNTLECVCVNPADHSVAPGKAGRRTVPLAQPISPGDIISPGHAVVTVTFNLDFAEGQTRCVNPLWTVLHDSCGVTDTTLVMRTFRCTGDPKTDPQPCFADNNPANLAPANLQIEATPRDTVNLHCFIGQIFRDTAGHTLSGQTFTCVET